MDLRILLLLPVLSFSQVTRVARKFTLEGGALKYEVFMATTTQPLELHLSALLQKVSKQ